MMNQDTVEQTKFNCHDKLSNRDSMGRCSTLTPNGPVVWGVAVCVRVGMRFCKVPVSGRALGVTIKLSRWRCKNHDNSASASSPIDIVTIAGLVMVLKF